MEHDTMNVFHRKTLFQVNKTYSVSNWRSDLKKVLKMAGSEYKQVAFLFTDLQIKEDTFLEDISMILNTGEVTMKFFRACFLWKLN